MKNQTSLPEHYETQVAVDAPPAEVFEFLDDHRRLSAHMTEPSWMMAGSHMTIALDEKQGRAVGSKITLSGRILGLSLEVEEVVTEYDRPYSKAWETVGSPRLLVMGPYRPGFLLSPRQGGSQLRVFIDYAPPSEGASRAGPAVRQVIRMVVHPSHGARRHDALPYETGPFVRHSFLRTGHELQVAKSSTNPTPFAFTSCASPQLLVS